MKSRFDILNIGQCFDAFMNRQYENILGCLCEKLGDGRYRWHDAVGTREQIEKAIMDAGTDLKNSLKK